MVGHGAIRDCRRDASVSGHGMVARIGPAKGSQVVSGLITATADGGLLARGLGIPPAPRSRDRLSLEVEGR
jgi:hypothetical protein